MIQRIQTVYLLLAVVALIVCMCNPVAAYVGVDGSVSLFTNLGVDVANVGRETSCWGMFALLLLSAIVALGTIFLFKNRMLQIRLTIFNILLQIGYYITLIAFVIAYNHKLVDDSFQLRFGVCLPFVSMVLCYLAVRAIGKDEVMVKAADRLR
jgi:hypothetical protein